MGSWKKNITYYFFFFEASLSIKCPIFFFFNAQKGKRERTTYLATLVRIARGEGCIATTVGSTVARVALEHIVSSREFGELGLDDGDLAADCVHEDAIRCDLLGDFLGSLEVRARLVGYL